MFDSVLDQNPVRGQFGRSAVLTFFVHALVLATVVYLSARPRKPVETDLRAITFLAPPAPPPPPPPPAAGASRPKPKVATKAVIRKPDTVVATKPREEAAETAKPDAPKDQPSGVEGGVPGGVAGGVVGGVVGGVIGGTGAIPFGAGMTRPTLLSKRDPQYTREALTARVQGLMLVKCIITVEGSLRSCRVVKGLPFMDKPVLEALAQWKYTPVTFQGRPVSVEYVIPVRLVPP